MVFSTTSFYIIDISRKELKSVLAYKDIHNIYLEKEDKIRITFNREINKVKFVSLIFRKLLLQLTLAKRVILLSIF